MPRALKSAAAAVVIVLFAAGAYADQEFQPLFNGTDLAGWEAIGGPANNWQVSGGVLSCTGGEGSHWLATSEEFADFELELEFKMPRDGNSGVFIRAPREGDPWIAGMEIQLLDDGGEKWKDLKPAQYTGAIYGAVAPSRRATKPADQWQTIRIRCVGRSCAVWINTDKVVDVNLDSLGAETTKSIPGLKRASGHIGLQNHGSPVHFRNILIRRIARASSSAGHAAVWVDLPGFEMSDEVRKLWDPSPSEADWARAERSAHYAGIALDKVQRWLRECCLPVRDERSGLFRPTGPEWNYQDTAADCYPFYVWAAYYTDREVLDTVMIPALEAEQRLCNHVDRLPVRYDMDRQEKIDTDFDTMVFGASEYAKDGLVAIVEITGKSYPWYDRMRGIVDDVFKHARYDTPYGPIPSTNIEVNGDLLQILPRLYSMTGERKYLDWAHRLADHYLLPGGFVPQRLSDHGCEIIGGLGLLFAVDRTACPDKCEQYRPYLELMFDQILERGTNSDGVIIGSLQDAPGPHDNVTIRDGWGYDFVGFLDYGLALGTSRYREAIQRPMTNLLKPRYKRFNWDHGSRDNVADSVEGGLYLLERIPTPEAFLWADREIATMLVDHIDPERLWGVHKLEANTVRTVLIHTMLHTRNTIVRPWQQRLRLGAAPCRNGICVLIESDQPYEGRLEFDVPRHRITMGFDQDWPRMNTVPEWFTVEPDDAHLYAVTDVDRGPTRTVTGKSLSEGLPIRVEAGRPLRLLVLPHG